MTFKLTNHIAVVFFVLISLTKAFGYTQPKDTLISFEKLRSMSKEQIINAYANDSGATEIIKNHYKLKLPVPKKRFFLLGTAFASILIVAEAATTTLTVTQILLGIIYFLVALYLARLLTVLLFGRTKKRLYKKLHAYYKTTS